MLFPVIQRELAEADLSLEELGIALKNMKNDTCPGLDGLSMNFYKFFWKEIGPVLFEALKVGLSEGKLHDSALPGHNKPYSKSWKRH